MRVLGLVFVGLFAACIEPELTPCGDLDCPGGTVCLVDRCVTPEQLAGCTGKADGDGCAVGTKVGQCANGACLYGGCGNSKIDPGEVCDDGNTAFGDGCSADCASLETCGNGVVDVALGEGCDCGADAASRPIGCRWINSDDLEAECTPDCKPRFCGDGAVDVLEQCDGTDLGTSSCADFGYYRGAPTCSAVCQLEIAGCTGRCGDGTIEPAFGEFCDQAPPAGSCLTYGYDAGYVGCSQACSVDAGHCERFGWVQLDSGDVQSVWASPTQALVIAAVPQSGTNAWMVINSIRELAPAGTYVLATGDGTRAYAIAADRMAVWSGTSWSTVSVGWAPATPTASWASPTLGVYAVVGGAVWRYSGGTWTDQGLSGVTGVSGGGAEVFAWTASTASTSTGGAWTTEALPALGGQAIDVFSRSGSGPTWLGAGPKLYRRDGGTWTSRDVGGRISSGQSTVEGDLLGVQSVQGVVRFFAQSTGGVQQALASPGSARTVSLTDDGGVAYASSTGAYRLRSGVWGTHDLILQGWAYAPWDGDEFARMEVTASGVITLDEPRGSSDNTGPWFGTDDFQPLAQFSFTLADDFTFARDGVGLYFSGSVTDEYGEPLLDAAIYDGDMTVIGYRQYHQMSPIRNGDVLVYGADVFARGTSSTAWQVLESTDYDIYAVDGNASGEVAALAYGNILLRIAPDNSITRLTVPGGIGGSDVWIAPDGEIVAVGGSQVVRCVQTTCTVETVGASLSHVSGTAGDDLFVAGIPTTDTFGRLSRWDGTRWYPVRSPGAEITDLYVDDRSIRFLDGSTRLYTLPRVARW